MKWSEIIAAFRGEAKDLKKPYLWTDTEAIEYANDAENQVARRTRCFLDRTTTAVCQIAVVAGTAIYALEPRVIFVRRLKLASQPYPLPKSDRRDLDACQPGWEDFDDSTPVTWVPSEGKKIELVPPPDTNDTLNAHVIRLPLLPLTEARLDTTPEAPAEWHAGMVNWMLARAYRKQHSQTNDPVKAKSAEDLFTREFGPLSSAIDENWIRLHHGQDEYEGLY